MAVRGTESKNLVQKVILSIFSSSFVNDKEIRIPVIENGEEIQIKLTLTASKTNIPHEGQNSIKEPLPKNIEEVVPIGPLTDEQKNKIIETLRDIIDIDLDFGVMKEDK